MVLIVSSATSPPAQSTRMTNRLLLLVAMALLLAAPALAGSKSDKAREEAKAKAKAEAEARKAEWKNDPKHCEVCLKVMTDLHGQVKALPKKQKKDKVTVLESNRARNLVITARRIGMSYDLLKQVILDTDLPLLPPEHAELLMAYVPSDEERELLQKHQHQREPGPDRS